MQTMLANMPMSNVASSLPGSLSGTSTSIGSTISNQTRETPLLTESLSSNLPNQPKPGSTSDKEAVLSSFFNSLLSRKSLTEANPTKPIQSTKGMTSNKTDTPNTSTKDSDTKS
ncbi:hypothetical protein Smp_113710 [Schistosoma mansoni]|uniref:hypothetical protein n=1 Tax=Schistosoma mansoni TaxID=6183 RepID=UPI00022DC059|nr:hypothetical protein Smp_113710 [Schistosoma mansoni]|eukprot:XP_018652781.1 hypothetical protein Smp_113710 [Schistosoma mansoni]